MSPCYSFCLLLPPFFHHTVPENSLSESGVISCCHSCSLSPRAKRFPFLYIICLIWSVWGKDFCFWNTYSFSLFSFFLFFLFNLSWVLYIDGLTWTKMTRVIGKALLHWSSAAGYAAKQLHASWLAPRAFYSFCCLSLPWCRRRHRMQHQRYSLFCCYPACSSLFCFAGYHSTCFCRG